MYPASSILLITPMNRGSSMRFSKSLSRMVWSMVSNEDVHLDQPLAPRPGVADLVESRVAGPSGAEPVRVLREHRLVDRLEQGPDHLLGEAVLHRGDA